MYITTPIYYVNDKPHLGHAYTGVACDALARFYRMTGEHVHFLTGTDEHGQKVEKSAATAGLPPQEFVDGVSQQFQDLAALMHLTNDDFIRTTQPRHKLAAQALWKRMVEAGDIYLGSYAGWYSVRDEAYVQESELVGGKAPSGADVEWVEEPSYFFALSKYTEKLLAYYEANPEFIAPASRRNEVIRFVEGGLKDLSVSRTTFRWGIAVPGDEKHVMYVWLDALVNYLSALDFPDESSDKWREFWPNCTHVVGKDILRFHAVYWPAFLMSAKLPLPKQIFAHGWWTVEGEKMSKSLGNVVVPSEMVEKYGLDATRYFLLRAVPFGADGNFSQERLLTIYHSELANTIGNLAQRTLSFIHKHCGGNIPNIQLEALKHSELYAIVNSAHDKFESISDSYRKLLFNKAIEDIIDIANQANEFIDREAPWTLKKTDPSKMEDVLYVICELIRVISIYLQPVIQLSSDKILDQLNCPESLRSFASILEKSSIPPGHALGAISPVFPRIEA